MVDSNFTNNELCVCVSVLQEKIYRAQHHERVKDWQRKSIERSIMSVCRIAREDL